MKRMFSWILTLVLMLGLAGCGQNAAAAWQEQYDLGVRYLSEGNYEEAILAFTAAIEIDAKRPEGLIGRGDAYAGQAEESGSPGEEDANTLYQNALADYLAAIEMDDQLVEAYEKAAGVYVSLGDLDAAIDLLEQGVEATGDEGLSDYLEELRDNTRLKLLTHQAAYDSDGHLVRDLRYSYDETGYLLRRDAVDYDNTGRAVGTERMEFQYDENSGSWWRIPNRQWYDTEAEWQAAWSKENFLPGTHDYDTNIGSVEFSVNMDPLILRSGGLEALQEGNVLYNEMQVNGGYADWSYAVYTFDEAGCPVAISSYYSDGSLSGTAVLEWEVLEP